jgi:hypothetical protein
VTKRAKTDAERQREHRRRKELLVDRRCRVVVATPWPKLGRAPRLGMWEPVWTGKLAEYEARCRDLNIPLLGVRKEPRAFGDMDLRREEYQTLESAVSENETTVYEGGRNRESFVPEGEKDIHEARGERILMFQYGHDRKQPKEPWKILWRGEFVTLDDYYRFKRWSSGPHCMRQVPKPVFRDLGVLVDIVPKEIIFCNWIHAMDGVTYNIDGWNERAVVSEWTTRVARGDVTSAYVSQPLTQVTGQPFEWEPGPLYPYSQPQPYAKRKPKPLVTAEDRRKWKRKDLRTPDWNALLDKTASLMALREAAGIPLRGGSIRKSERHVSAAYRASIAPREMKMAA